MDDISMLLVLEAHDKASSIIGKVTGAFEAMGEKVKAAAARAAMSTEQLQAVQDRAAAAATAYSRAQTEQANKQAVLRQSTIDLAMAEEEYAAKTAAAAEAARKAATATGEEAAAAREAARVQAESAQMAAQTVADASARQVAAADAVIKADDEVALRSRQSAEAQRAAAEGTGLGTAALKGVAVAGAAAAVAVGAVGVHAVKAAGDFQQGMTRLVTSAGESESAVGKVSSGVLKLSVDTATSTDELSKGLYMIESAGYHGAAGLAVLKAAAQGARAEGASLDEVGNALTSMLNAYGMKASDATRATDMMVATVAAGKMKMQDLASSLSAVLPVAAAAHISFQQVGAAIATMTSQGMSAQQATQNLSHLIQKLQSPTAESTKYLAQLGLDAQDLSAHLGERGLTGTLDMVYKAIAQHIGPSGQVVVDAFNKSQAAARDLQEMLKNMPPDLARLGKAYMDGSVSVKQMTTDIKGMSGPNATMMKQFVALAANSQGFNQMLKTGNPAALTFAAALKKTLGDSTSLNTALLIGGSHMATFKANVASVADAARKAGKDVNGWSEIQHTFNFKMAQLKDSVHAAVIAIGIGLLPAVTKIAQAVVTVVKPVAEWMTAHQKLSTIILASIGGLGALVATIIGVAFAVKKVKEAFTALQAAFTLVSDANPIILALTAIALVAILIATHWKQTKQIVGEVWDWITSAASDVAGFFVRVWKDVVKVWDDIWGAIGGTVKKWWPLILAPFTGGMSLIVGIIIKYRTQIGHAFEAIWNFLVDVWDATGGKLIGAIEQAWSSASQSASREWNRISGDLSQIWGELVQLWNATGGKLVSFISDHWAQIEEISKIVWGAIWGDIKLVWGYISSYIGSVLGTIGDIIATAWAVISGVAKVAWNLIWGYIKGVWDLIVGVVKAALDIIYGVLIKPTFEAIKAFFIIIWDVIKGVINTALDLIKGSIRIFTDIVTGNWQRLWTDVKNLVSSVLRDIWSTISSIFNTITRFLTSVMSSIKSGLLGAWRDIWNGINGFLSSIWNGIKGAFNAGLDALGNIWNRLKKLAADPVNFVISTVYDNGIRTLWNDVSGLFGGPSAPYVNPVRFAKGGIVPGSGTGDTVPALLTPGEFVLSLDMIRRAGGPGAIEAAFGAGANDGRHYAGGGWSWNPITDIKHLGGYVIKGLDALKDVALGGIHAAAATAFKGLNAVLGHMPGAGTGLGKMMTSGVKSIENNLLNFFGKKDKTAIAAPGHVSGTLVQWLTAAIRATGAPMSWLNGLEVIAMNESGGNPNAINNWDSNAAAGDPSRGLMQTIMSTFMAYHQSGTSSNIYDPIANAAAAINYIKSVYGNINNVPGIRSMAHGGPYVGYESGTWDTGAYPQMALLHPHEAVLPAGALGGSRLGGFTTVVFDFRGTQVMSNRDIDLLVDKIGRQFTQKVLPMAGVQVQR
ncbi:phage tail tape measure protein [Streptomyces sp. NPDC001634]|uniref:phage tail tape measure protein n=1 Tax=Streptomyces sp. NPDC001634 TaxID=3154390 RepID=UPI003321A2CD